MSCSLASLVLWPRVCAKWRQGAGPAPVDGGESLAVPSLLVAAQLQRQAPRAVLSCCTGERQRLQWGGVWVGVQ